MDLVFNGVLYEPGDRMRDVYFPSRSLVSLLTLVEGHLALQVGMVGREGMVGRSPAHRARHPAPHIQLNQLVR